MNYNNFTQETSRMLELMKYGINENASKSSAPRVEYSVKAADGLTYGIVNEGTKFYIKVAPKKDTQIVNEDFDYIGGERNKKQNEYKSYSLASKNLELKLMQINESHKANKVIIESVKKEPAADWQINETKEMRNAINRMNQISHNVAMILEDKKDIKAYGEKVGNVDTNWTDNDTKPNTYKEEPVGKTHVAKDEDWTNDDENPSKEVKKTNDKIGSSCTSDTAKKTTGFTEKPKMPDTLKEGKRVIKLTEEQVLAWNRSNDDYMDKSHGTEIGSSAPFDDNVCCKASNQCKDSSETVCEAEGPVHNSDTTLYPNGSTGDVSHNGDPFKEGKDSKAEADNGVIAESEFDDDEIAGFDGLDDEYDDVPFPEVEDEDEYEIELDDDDATHFLKRNDLGDSLLNREMSNEKTDMGQALNNINNAYSTAYDDMDSEGMFDDEEELYENELHDFGKHPAYRKSPFSLPANREVAPNGARDWNDDSVEGDLPYGKKIGSSAPYEKAVQVITDSIMESLGF